LFLLSTVFCFESLFCVRNVRFIGVKANETKCLFDPLCSNNPVNIILKAISYLKENTLRLPYKNHVVDDV
jgi:hypothetical protein